EFLRCPPEDHGVRVRGKGKGAIALTHGHSVGGVIQYGSVIFLAAAPRLIGGQPLRRLGDDIGGGLDEGDVVVGKFPPLVGIDGQYSERSPLPTDCGAQARLKVGVQDWLRQYKAAIAFVVIYDNRLAGAQAATTMGTVDFDQELLS